ncbi:hypothetical protein [Bradyrhizobium sp. JYMT SZCCT0428]|uniref:hypothetical protein n=1 Tax=Bradyrhizobium sp. JYMT SZCCT0428 TaxID=2807673 RepID=UPI001BA77071|nr:hypothetical protein [Bradyrhizobium sp. JYMT SZCCT0428]MBR1157213.1 hypothetical protein [Bradyrhizobium sp. JYMT SZCCT0428]
MAVALSAQSLVILGGIGSFARAEDRSSSSPVVVSACRAPIPFVGDPKIQSEMRKGSEFARVAFLHSHAGNYERAFEQFDRAINVNPVNPLFYILRGMTRTRTQEFGLAIEFDKAIALNPASSVAFSAGDRHAVADGTQLEGGHDHFHDRVTKLEQRHRPRGGFRSQRG